jgi:hypothetical protein
LPVSVSYNSDQELYLKTDICCYYSAGSVHAPTSPSKLHTGRHPQGEFNAIRRNSSVAPPVGCSPSPTQTCVHARLGRPLRIHAPLLELHSDRNATLSSNFAAFCFICAWAWLGPELVCSCFGALLDRDRVGGGGPTPATFDPWRMSNHRWYPPPAPASFAPLPFIQEHLSPVPEVPDSFLKAFNLNQPVWKVTPWHVP